MEKRYVIPMKENTRVKQNKARFRGYIVHCKDVDSGDEFNVEVLLNEKIDIIDIPQKAESSARKNDIVQMSGNTFEFEYLQPSGKIIEWEQHTLTTEVCSRTKESEEILEQMKLE